MFVKKLGVVFSFLFLFGAVFFVGTSLASDGTLIDENLKENNENEGVEVLEEHEEEPSSNNQLDKDVLVKELGVKDQEHYFKEDGTLVVYDKQNDGDIGIMCGSYSPCLRSEFTVTDGPNTSYGSWQDGVEGTGSSTNSSLSLSTSVGVSNNYSGSLSGTVSGLSASVGFNVNYSTNVTASYTTDLSPGQTKVIQYRGIFDRYNVTERRYSNDQLIATNYLTASQYSHLGYRAITR
ncbi:hypothetical protein HXA31_01985 [Salipaludibacillus agaradhaerens]|jgi:hypothetical protein|uniref:Uncharacterized protein n=1 Tax=Salipaludibacillus agaradhaerens TaxID=76935 RepID=A0A9Q4B2Y6_SALAG|nr:hypothetical protein [Salipaludibacillus agaradhaerens]MCR6097379.1 hypothetical protein [Salipaludibacillus agaradhaerens]MCR6113136.1 hypothetical protein [Salipaludibacillus agaradhaerens]